MERLWQTLILIQQYPVFEFHPIEVLITERQEIYYAKLSESDKKGHSTPFIEFILNIILYSLSTDKTINTIFKLNKLFTL
jgi:Fic family protein